MFSNDSRSLLEDSRRNVEPGTPQVATDQRRYFPIFSFFDILVSTCVESKCGVFVGNSEFVFPFVLPLPLVMLSVSSAADTNRKV